MKRFLLALTVVFMVFLKVAYADFDYSGLKKTLKDSGILFNLTESDVRIGELSSFILSGLMEAHQEKAYLVTTGYNRNMIRFPRK